MLHLLATMSLTKRPPDDASADRPDSAPDWDAIHRDLLARTWKPDRWGRHDALTRHPYTNKPGKVLLLSSGERVWVPDQQHDR